MNKPTRSFLSSLLLLTAFASLWASMPLAQARRAYSYADMYAPQEAEVKVVKPKKKVRKPKSKPISVYVSKPLAKKAQKEAPLADLPLTQESNTKKPEPKIEKAVETPKQKLEEPKQVVATPIPERNTSQDSDKAKRITLEELLGQDVVKGMSSR
ncbi:hypothetical protein KA183_15235 [bacterium]|nr:hypothetical protein [bacterium]